MYRKEKLTKKLLLSLKTGDIISSNVYEPQNDGNYQSATLDIVPDHSDRKDLWQEIKRKKTDGRLCYIYDSNEAYEEHQKELNAIIKKN